MRALVHPIFVDWAGNYKPPNPLEDLRENMDIVRDLVLSTKEPELSYSWAIEYILDCSTLLGGGALYE